MVRIHIFACHLPQAEADALDAGSGRVYLCTLVFHYRVYRRHGHWLFAEAGCRADGSQPPPSPGERVAAVDLGEVHPAALCDEGVDSSSPAPEADGSPPIVFSARVLRSLYQYTAKRLAEIQRKQTRKKKLNCARTPEKPPGLGPCGVSQRLCPGLQ